MGRVQGAIVGAQKAVESNAGQLSMGVATLGLTMPFEGEMIANNTEKDSSVSTSKFVPNPYGRLGGPAHREVVSQTIDELKLNGYTSITQELKIFNPEGQKQYRFGDIYALSSEGNHEIFQIGKQTQAGNPIAREVRGQQDINSGYFIGINGNKQNIDSTTFVPYSK